MAEVIVEALLVLGCGFAGALTGTIIGLVGTIVIVLILQHRDSPAVAGAMVYAVFLVATGALVGVLVGVVVGGFLYPQGIGLALAIAVVLIILGWWRINRWRKLS